MQLALFLVLAALTSAAEPIQKKPTKPLPPAAPAKAPAVDSPSPEARQLRSAPCVLTLKGRTEFRTKLPSKKPEETKSKRVLEDFEYRLPGTLVETQQPDGTVEFAFTPSEKLAGTQAKGVLHLEDDAPSPGWAPVVMDASDLQNAGVFLFRAHRRGQSIHPAGGASVNLRGTLKSLAPMANTRALGETQARPVASTPFPALGNDLTRLGLPVLRFEGLALWAWANTKGPAVFKGSVKYQNHKNQYGTLDGEVTVSFEIGPQAP